MIIKGVNYLNNNNYKNIIVNPKTITVTSEVDNTYSKDKSFSKSLKRLNNDEIISKVIEYYLENNEIDYIDDIYYSKDCLDIFGNYKRLLRLYKYSKEDEQKIIDKYIKDRIKFTENNDIYSFYINKREDNCYYKNNYGSMFIDINNKRDVKNIEYIYYLIDYVFKDKIIGLKFGDYLELCLANYDKKIFICIDIFDEDLNYNELTAYIYNHNEEIKNKIRYELSRRK